MKNVNFKVRHQSGTFLSDWLVRSWNDTQWESELEAMKEIGMEYLILAPNTLIKKDGGYLANYPTKIKGFEKAYDGTDVIENLLRNAKKYDMKVFLGLNMHEDWWDNWWSTEITTYNKENLYKEMQQGNIVAKELYTRYKKKYPDTFYGWYWVWEFWNSKAMKLGFLGRNQNIKVFCNCLNINLDYLSQLDPNMPLLLSPFTNMRITSYDDLYYIWVDILKNTNFRKGDILSPQDSVGGGGTNMSQLRECYKVFKKACDTNKNIRLWANNECFDHTDWSSATLERFKLQTDITAEFAEKNITFAYNNYYSPNNVDAGFHQTYLNYLKTGKLNEEIPSKVSNVSVKHEKNNTIITWDEKQNVAGYFIYKNEKVIGSIKAQRNDGKGYIPKMDCTWKDEANENTNNNYFVACFDYAGNLAVPQKAKLI